MAGPLKKYRFFAAFLTLASTERVYRGGLELERCLLALLVEHTHDNQRFVEEPPFPNHHLIARQSWHMLTLQKHPPIIAVHPPILKCTRQYCGPSVKIAV